MFKDRNGIWDLILFLFLLFCFYYLKLINMLEIGIICIYIWELYDKFFSGIIIVELKEHDVDLAVLGADLPYVGKSVFQVLISLLMFIFAVPSVEDGMDHTAGLIKSDKVILPFPQPEILLEVLGSVIHIGKADGGGHEPSHLKYMPEQILIVGHQG